jgi:uncharacterized RDD family membrane protein YckC
MSDQEWPSAPGDSGEGSTPPSSSPPPATPSQGSPPPASPPPPSAPPPPPPAPSGYGAGVPSGVGQPADLGIRFGARLIDSILLAIVNVIITAVILFGVFFSNLDAGTPGGLASFGFSVGSFVASLVLLAITLGYFVFLESTRGATVGKMLLNLRVQNASGGLPTAEESFKRNAFYVLNIIPFVGGLLQLAAVIYIAVTISQDPGNRGWHDQFAGTVVVRA